MKHWFVAIGVVSLFTVGNASFAKPTKYGFEAIKSANEKNLETSLLSAEALDTKIDKESSGVGVEPSAFNAYQITGDLKPKTATSRLKKTKTESKEDMYLRAVKRALHRDYPITGDDGGYRFQRLTTEDSVEKSIPDEMKDEDSKEAKAFIEDLKKAVTDKKLLVFIGSGSGNNTSAEIVTVISPKDNQFYYLINSNFGSDD